MQVRQHHRSPLDDEADVANERLIQDRMHGLVVVGHALGVARRRGAWCLGIQVGHRPIVSVLAQLVGFGVRPTAGWLGRWRFRGASIGSRDGRPGRQPAVIGAAPFVEPAVDAREASFVDLGVVDADGHLRSHRLHEVDGPCGL